MATAVKLKVSRRGNGAQYLANIARKMTGSVKVGFLAGATYPEDYKRDQSRLKKLRKARAVQRYEAQTAENVRRRIVGLTAKPEPVLKISQGRVGPAAPRGVLRVAQVAYWNEYGKKGQKPRPFMRNTIADKSKEWGATMGALAEQTGYDGQKILRTIGTRIKDDFVTAIKSWPADNSPVTVAIKGFNKGLIDRGIMQRAVDFEVQK